MNTEREKSEMREQLRLKYSGPALDSGEMDVQDLGPALLAIGDLLSIANARVNEGRGRVRVAIPGFEKGSFDVLVNVEFFSLIDKALDLFGSPKVCGAVFVLNLIFGSGMDKISVFDFLRWLKGRKPDKIEENADGTLNVLIGSDQPITITKNVFNIAGDVRVLKAVESLSAPIRQEGVDGVTIYSGEKELQKITKDDVDAFRYRKIEVGDSSIKTTRKTIGIRRFIVPPLRSTQHQFVSSGETFPAKISDDVFLKKAQTLAVSAADYLDADVRETRVITSESVETTYEIMKVHRHIPGPQQETLLSG